MQGPKAYLASTRLASHGMWMSHLPPGLGLRCSLLQEFCSLRSSPTRGCTGLTSVWSLAPSLRPICAPSALPAPSPSRSPGEGAGLQVPESPALPVGGAGASPPRAQFGRRWQFSNFGAEPAGRRLLVQTPHPKPHPAPLSPRSGHPEKMACPLYGLTRRDTWLGLVVVVVVVGFSAHFQDGKLRHGAIRGPVLGTPATRGGEGMGFEPRTL